MESKYKQLEKRNEKLEQENKILEGKQLDLDDLKEKLSDTYSRIKAENEYQQFLREKHSEEVQNLKEKCQDLEQKQAQK